MDSLKKTNLLPNRISFEKFLKSSKTRKNVIDTDDGKEFVKDYLTDFLNINHIRRYSCHIQKKQFLMRALVDLLQDSLNCLYLKK